MAPTRSYDLLVLGATGFTGRLACEYLGSSAPPSLRWAPVGRDASKLARLLGSPSPIVCDLADASKLEELIAQTSVVANYAGSPFSDKALPIVALCAKYGTGYVDISGETPLARASYDEWDEKAKETGALIVHQCGFDSIPSDMGAFLAVHELRSRFHTDASEIKTMMMKSRGGFSGGTLHTILYYLRTKDSEIPGASEAAKRGAYALDPAGATGGPDKDNYGGKLLRYDSRFKTWHVPFFMAESNAPIVRKSAALLGYGNGCSYAEVTCLHCLALSDAI